MRKKQYIIYAGLLFLAIILIISIQLSLTSAALLTPSNDAIISGRTSINISKGVQTSYNGNWSCDLYAGSTLTANTTWTRVNMSDGTSALSIHNNTAGASGNGTLHINSTFLSQTLEDANNYVFNITCMNNTEIIQVNTTTGITIDNTVPAAATAISPTGTQINKTMTFVSTVTNSQTTSCSLRFVGANPGSASYTMVYLTNTCSAQINNTPESSYQFYIRTSDESNTTDSAVQTILIDEEDVSASARYTSQLIQEGKIVSKDGTLSIAEGNGQISKGTWAVIIIILVIIVAVVLARRK